VRTQRDREEQSVTITIALTVFASAIALILFLLPSDVSGAMVGGVLLVAAGLLAIIWLLEAKRH
jgi:hypothetical protein